ncbi:hypothetical protein Tco_0669779 [Tanacetum coccineum]
MLLMIFDQSIIYGVSADVDTAYSSKSGNGLEFFKVSRYGVCFKNDTAYRSDAFNAFATEFGTNKASPRRSNVNLRKEDQLEAGRQELQGLKQTLASRTPSPNKSASKNPCICIPKPIFLSAGDDDNLLLLFFVSRGSQTSVMARQPQVHRKQKQRNIILLAIKARMIIYCLLCAAHPHPYLGSAVTTTAEASGSAGGRKNVLRECASKVEAWGVGRAGLKVGPSFKENTSGGGGGQKVAVHQRCAGGQSEHHGCVWSESGRSMFERSVR